MKRRANEVQELRCYLLRQDGQAVVELGNFMETLEINGAELNGGRTAGSSSDLPTLLTTCSMVYHHFLFTRTINIRKKFCKLKKSV